MYEMIYFANRKYYCIRQKNGNDWITIYASGGYWLLRVSQEDMNSKYDSVQVINNQEEIKQILIGLI
jgi:hypothetical protein